MNQPNDPTHYDDVDDLGWYFNKDDLPVRIQTPPAITGTWLKNNHRIDIAQQGDRYYAVVRGFWGAILNGGQPVVFPTTDDARQAIQRLEASGYNRRPATRPRPASRPLSIAALIALIALAVLAVTIIG